MRSFILFFIVLTSGCVSLDNNLQNALAFGERKELNEYSPNVDKQLLVRLYSSPLYKDHCFIETHGTCKYSYFLSVATFDEYPETNIYKLKTEGEIIAVNWKQTDVIDSAEIDLVFNQFSMRALENNASLMNHEQRVQIKVNISEIVEVIDLVKDR
ncbi:MAG: hypothetical protein JKY50_02835 [Oleispira sp.]|nr:hypothetical protein [Oleispira sp.]MBL4880115.1 hypothetical protein [Oleispira sp.]